MSSWFGSEGARQAKLDQSYLASNSPKPKLNVITSVFDPRVMVDDCHTKVK